MKIRNILVVALIQDLLILVATLALAGSVPTTHAWLITAQAKAITSSLNATGAA